MEQLQRRITWLLGVRGVQDEVATDKILLPWDFLIENSGEVSYVVDQTLQQRAFFQNQNNQATERSDLN